MQPGTYGTAVFVAGGLNEDIKARSFHTFISRTSNPGRLHRSPGGVARNIAHSIALLGPHPILCSAAGQDSGGSLVLNATKAAGVDTSAVFQFHDLQTGTYLAIQNEKGELEAAVSSMEIMEALTPEKLDSVRSSLTSAEALIVDTNLPESSISHIVGIANLSGIPCMAEPVSVEKSRRLSGVIPYCNWISPNLDELCEIFSIKKASFQGFLDSLTDRPGEITALEEDFVHTIETTLHTAASKSPGHARPIMGDTAPNILVTLGAEGVLLLSRDRDCSNRAGPLQEDLKSAPQQERQSLLPSLPWWAWWYPPLRADVVDANGAGDAFIAGFAAASLSGSSSDPHCVTEAIKWGQAAAAITLETGHTVAPDLSREAIVKRLAE